MEFSKEENLLIAKAKNAKTQKEIVLLSLSRYSNVRRCIAKNRNTPKHILEKLAYDPVSNVCYVALNNPNCPVSRDMTNYFEKCVLCKKDEETYINECTKCD